MSESSTLRKRGDHVSMDDCQHYFIKDEKGMIGCVAITPMSLSGPDAGRICRGISLCSEKDLWDRNDGHKKAVARIRRAVGTESNDLRIQNEENPTVIRFYETPDAEMILGADDYVDKVAYNVEPTEREMGILYHLVRRLGGTPIEPTPAEAAE